MIRVQVPTHFSTDEMALLVSDVARFYGLRTISTAEFAAAADYLGYEAYHDHDRCIIR